MEEIDYFKYLSYTLQRNGSDRHIKETVRKAKCCETGLENRTKKICGRLQEENIDVRSFSKEHLNIWEICGGKNMRCTIERWQNKYI